VLLGSGWSFLSQLRPVSAAEAQLHPSLVHLDAGIEPTVRLLEETPRERLIEEVASRVKGGLSYRELLAALLLAGVRNVQPRPAVDSSSTRAGDQLGSPREYRVADEDRWLPIFWALDRFKSAQLKRKRPMAGAWARWTSRRFPPLQGARSIHPRDGRVGRSRRGRRRRGLGAHRWRNEVFELFARYGAPVISATSATRPSSSPTVSAPSNASAGTRRARPPIPRLRASPIRRRQSRQNRRRPDRPWRKNVDLAKKISPQWLDGKPSAEATSHLLSTFRTAPTISPAPR